ncbi:MAG: GNAT family N-acetyltransferase [Rhodoferax sp.]|uniref:GNAT family N-acetyltransferase n=1 Tax=Rhodoferax sp. TaxID=50421 RepID=UPI002630C839|nr:GNAT family N-acetyltransferase [Rhodoferax sp.]MDD2882829.1 GNAT family N-acetyltransferase [Rhodoferax sp.]
MSIEFSYLDPGKVYAGRKQFDCEHAAINKFVHDSLVSQVKKNLIVANVLTDSDHGDRLVGLFTIANHTIDATLLSDLQLGSLPKQIPCARLIMLGVDKAYKGADLGRRLMKQALLITKQASAQMGSYGLYLNADPGAVNFYKKLGCLLLEGDQSPKPSPMFIAVNQIA